MPKLNLITEPDKLHNENTSVLLINPAESVKHDFNERAKQFEKDVNVYMFEVKDPDDQQNLKWLIEIANAVDVIIFDVNGTDGRQTSENKGQGGRIKPNLTEVVYPESYVQNEEQFNKSHWKKLYE